MMPPIDRTSKSEFARTLVSDVLSPEQRQPIESIAEVGDAQLKQAFADKLKESEAVSPLFPRIRQVFTRKNATFANRKIASRLAADRSLFVLE